MYLLCACCYVRSAFHVLSPVNFPCAFAESAAGYFSAAIAACSINRATSAGCEMNGTWLDLISVVFAPMRFAKNRWRFGFRCVPVRATECQLTKADSFYFL